MDQLPAVSPLSFFLGVVASLAASGIVLLIARWRQWIVLGKGAKARRLWQFARRMEEIGMINFFASRSDYSRYRESGKLSDYLATADTRIDVAGYWMGHGNEAEAIAKSIVASLHSKPGLRVRIALIDPDGAHVDAVAS